MGHEKSVMQGRWAGGKLERGRELTSFEASAMAVSQADATASQDAAVSPQGHGNNEEAREGRRRRMWTRKREEGGGREDEGAAALTSEGAEQLDATQPQRGSGGVQAAVSTQSREG